MTVESISEALFIDHLPTTGPDSCGETAPNAIGSRDKCLPPAVGLLYKFSRTPARSKNLETMTKTKLLMLSLSIAALALISSCSSQPTKQVAERPVAEQSQAAAPLPANIKQLLSMAEHATPPRSTELRIDAAQIAADKKDKDQASAILGSIGTIKDHVQLARFLLVKARLALLNDRPDLALRLLDDQRMQALPLTAARQIRIGRIRAEALYETRRYIASARERILIDNLLNGKERSKNHELIFSTLQELPADTLAQDAENAISGDVRGWLSLAAMTKQYQNDPLKQLDELNKWKQLWAGHPAALQLPRSLQMLSSVVAKRPKVIALLLPMNGDLGPYGRAIRNGILAAHYASSDSPEIKIYDTSSGNVISLLDQAKADGAQLAIGPLDRSKVTTLAHVGKLPMPVLALNRTLDGSVNPNLYQFGLSPEEEDVQVANEVFREGKRKALVIYPDGNWGTRNFDAFKNRWQALGGTIVDSAQYSVQRDYSDMIKDVLYVQESEDRANELERIIGRQVEFTPRRRQDIDFVFLLADPVEARKINPTLAFYYAQNVPVYATSHIHEGASPRINTMDLNGIRFCDMPWKLIHTGKLQAEVEKLWPASKRSLAPFYALGIDAYHLYPRLQQIKDVPNAKLFGNTGVLQVNDKNIVKRTLMWAEFANGRAVPMPVVMPDNAG